MGVSERFLMSFGVAIFCLVLKWVAVRWIATNETADFCFKVFGEYPPQFSFFRQFRSLGFDLANASVGLMAVAYVLESSNFHHICGEFGKYNRLFDVLCFLIFAIFYIIGAKIRYIFLETAERTFSIPGSWIAGLTLTLVGWTMLLSASYFVVDKG